MALDFIIAIDTEGDNLWSRPRTVTTRNAACLPRFQALAERHAFAPTWLVNWEMAREPACVEFLRDVLGRGAGEVGLHLHAWDTPPLESLTDDDTQCHPFLGEYPEPLRRAKIERLAGLIEETFQRPLRSHRAGRWAFDEFTARILRERGFTADCSVCPGVNWRATKGDPQGAGGPDYSAAPVNAYLMDDRDITRPAAQPPPGTLLEVPMTILPPPSPWMGKLIGSISPRHYWLRPNGRNGAAMRGVVERAMAAGRSHLMFMLHSSELLPGGSPTFRDDAAIEAMYADTEALFAHVAERGGRGRTLGAFADDWHRARLKAG